MDFSLSVSFMRIRLLVSLAIPSFFPLIEYKGREWKWLQVAKGQDPLEPLDMTSLPFFLCALEQLLFPVKWLNIEYTTTVEIALLVEKDEGEISHVLRE